MSIFFGNSAKKNDVENIIVHVDDVIDGLIDPFCHEPNCVIIVCNDVFVRQSGHIVLVARVLTCSCLLHRLLWFWFLVSALL